MADEKAKLMVEQDKLIRHITNATTNIKKLGERNITIPILEERQRRLTDNWKRFDEIDTSLQVLISDDEKKGITYFTQELAKTAEDSYNANLDQIIAWRIQLEEKVDKKINESTTPQNTSTQSLSISKLLNLPRISLPIFTGKYVDWISYRNMFESLVANRADLDDIQRFHYLRESTEGEPHALFQNADVNSENYKVAWQELKNRYENERFYNSSQSTDA